MGLFYTCKVFLSVINLLIYRKCLVCYLFLKGEELQYGLPIISEKGKQGGHKRSNDMDIYPDSDGRNNQRDQFLFGRENCHYVHSSEESSEPFTV